MQTMLKVTVLGAFSWFPDVFGLWNICKAGSRSRIADKIDWGEKFKGIYFMNWQVKQCFSTI